MPPLLPRARRNSRARQRRRAWRFGRSRRKILRHEYRIRIVLVLSERTAEPIARNFIETEGSMAFRAGFKVKARELQLFCFRFDRLKQELRESKTTRGRANEHALELA